MSAIERHPSFDLSNHKNDFAVLFLEGTGFDAMPHIAPICLPSVGPQMFKCLNVYCHWWDIKCSTETLFPPQPCVEFKDENCVANGWGKNKFGSDGRYLVFTFGVWSLVGCMSVKQ